MELSNQSVLRDIPSRKKLYRNFFQEFHTWGKSSGRVLLNQVIKDLEIGGEILDLGAKSPISSYNRWFKKKADCHYTYIDLFSQSADVVNADLEQPWPKFDQQFDYILCFNLLEHIYNFENVLTESYKNLKSPGQLIGSVPFLGAYHADPHDYFRYTHESLERLLKQAGFNQVVIYFLGFGPFYAAWSQYEFIFPNWLRGIGVSFNILLDLIFLKFYPRYKHKFADGYLFVATK